jgi:hypothetical protein
MLGRTASICARSNAIVRRHSPPPPPAAADVAVGVAQVTTITEHSLGAARDAVGTL